MTSPSPDVSSDPVITTDHGPDAQQRPAADPAPATVRVVPTSTVAMVSLIAGIFGAVGGCLFCGLPPIVAIVTGHVGLAHTRRDEASGYGMALAGLILGYALMIPTLLMLFISLFTVVNSGPPEFVREILYSF
ncbi:hypothetical protein GCM10027280_22290 [Micromonospora polyrhachis]